MFISYHGNYLYFVYVCVKNVLHCTLYMSATATCNLQPATFNFNALKTKKELSFTSILFFEFEAGCTQSQSNATSDLTG